MHTERLVGTTNPRVRLGRMVDFRFSIYPCRGSNSTCWQNRVEADIPILGTNDMFEEFENVSEFWSSWSARAGWRQCARGLGRDPSRDPGRVEG